MKSGADNLRLFARGDRVVDRFRAARDGDVGCRFGVAIDRLVSLLAERRHVLAIDRRDARQLFGERDGRLERLIIHLIRRGRTTLPPIHTVMPTVVFSRARSW